MKFVELKLEPEGDLTLLDLIARQTGLLISVCGGRGKCGKCRVKLAPEGQLTQREEQLLVPDDIREGFRLACSVVPEHPLTVLVPEWLIMNPGERTGSSRLKSQRSRAGSPTVSGSLGMAVDIGTTNVDVSIFDLKTGRRVQSGSFLNPQMSFGADVISRISRSRELIRDNALIAALERRIRKWGLRQSGISRTVAVGNTAMCHFLLRTDATPLGTYPFESALPLHQVMARRIPGLGRHQVRVLPLIGAFLGADTTAAIVSSGMHKGRKLSLLIDLGTNGEIVLGNRDRVLACSTAAGPAFEGANLSCGVLARPGAILDLQLRTEAGEMRVTGLRTRARRKPIGLCGSAVIKLLAELRRTGMLQANGRLKNGSAVTVVRASSSGTGHDISLTQADIRELQLAKGAIASGIRILLRESGAKPEAIRHIHLTGQLGNKLDSSAAAEIGLLPGLRRAVITQHPNRALAGAELALLHHEQESEFEETACRTEEVILSRVPDFNDIFVAGLGLTPWA